MSHTPLPWEIYDTTSGYVVGSEEGEVTTVPNLGDAEFIVRAVNNSEAFEELLEAAKVVVESIRAFHKSQGFDRIGYQEDLPSWAQPLQKAIEKADG